MSAGSALPANPFPGIEPFGLEHRDLFFGRDRDAEALLRRMVMYRGTLLYGEQGVGKSSILNAGLMPRAIEEGYEPWRIRVQPVPGRELILESLGEAEWLSSGSVVHAGGGRVTLAAETLAKTVGAYSGGQRLLLVFDQFEEWITLFEYMADEESAQRAETAQAAICDAVVELVLSKKLPAKVFLTFREDYLAKMTPIFDRAPNLPDQFVRLLPVAGAALAGAIRGPFERFPGHYSPPFKDALAAEIVTDLKQEAPGRPVRTTEMQIVCRELYAMGGVDPQATYAEAGGAEGLLRRYFTAALDAIDPDLLDPAVVLLTRLVSPAGTRNVVSRDDVVRRVELEEGLEPDLVGRALEALERDAKLAKLQRREDVDYYEIASEFLIDWVADQRQRMRTRELENRIDQQEAVIEEQESRLRSLAGRLTVGSVIALLGAQLLMLSLFISPLEDNVNFYDVGIAGLAGPVMGIAAAAVAVTSAIRDRPTSVRRVGLAFVGSLAGAYLVTALFVALPELYILHSATGWQMAFTGSILATLGCFLELRWWPRVTERAAALVALPLLALSMIGPWILEHDNVFIGTIERSGTSLTEPFLDIEGFGAFDIGTAAWLGPTLALVGVMAIFLNMFRERDSLYRIGFAATALGAVVTLVAYPVLLAEDILPDWGAVVAVPAAMLAAVAGLGHLAGTAGSNRLRRAGRLVAIAGLPVLLVAPFAAWWTDGRTAIDLGFEWWAGSVVVAAGAALSVVAALSVRGRRARTALVGVGVCLAGLLLGTVLFAEHHVVRAAFNEPAWVDFNDGKPLPTFDWGFYLYASTAIAVTFAAFSQVAATQRPKSPRWSFGRVVAACGVVALGVSLLLPWTEIDSSSEELDIINTANALEVGISAWSGVALVMAGATWLVARAFESNVTILDRRNLASTLAGAAILLGTTLIGFRYVIDRFDRMWGVVVALLVAAVTTASTWQGHAEARAQHRADPDSLGLLRPSSQASVER